jgi:exopolyphosphatase/guanosine-5'-triphosphate,3'-diphosphate pyrophosphatase
MLCGCIDIGTNTTRVLVVDARDGRLIEVFQQRVFTRLGRGLRPGGTIPRERIDATARVVAEQRAIAARLGAPVRAVATAVIRSAANRDEFCAAMLEHGGVEVCVLEGEEEARLAFLGATQTLGRALDGSVGVVDVGGGSTEIAVGTLASGVEWAASFAFGSCSLAEQHLLSDPPTTAQLEAAAAHAAAALEGVAPPVVATAVAVGGSAASLRRLVGGDVLEPAALARALGVLAGAPAATVARRFGLEEERVKLLPAGLVALAAAGHVLGRPLQIGNGGLREGVVLDLARASQLVDGSHPGDAIISSEP